MKRNWFRKLLQGLSFTSMMFVFQACYGTGQDFGYDFLVEGQVISKSTLIPIKGIKVAVSDNEQYQLTDDKGHFSFYTEAKDSVKIIFEDIDSLDAGNFINQDTLLTHTYNDVFLHIKMEEK